MKGLVLLHHPGEGPGTLGDFLAARGLALTSVRLFAGEAIPSGDFDLVVVMGGPMNVYEETRHPWLGPETAFLAQRLGAGRPVVGICLGAQLMAKALGARVVRSPREEIGWRRVALTPAGRRSPFLAGLPASFAVLQWHGDMFELPAGAELLATGADCPHQAFAHGPSLGLQFHLETTREMVEGWYETPAQAAEIGPGWAVHGRGMADLAASLYANLWRLLTQG